GRGSGHDARLDVFLVMAGEVPPAAVAYLGGSTSTVGSSTSRSSVSTLGTDIVSFVVPTSTEGVLTVSVSTPTTGLCTSYSPSPVFSQPASRAAPPNMMVAVSVRTTRLPLEVWPAAAGT